MPFGGLFSVSPRPAGPGWAPAAVQCPRPARRGAQEGSGAQHGQPVPQVCTSLLRGAGKGKSASTGPARCKFMDIKCRVLVF